MSCVVSYVNDHMSCPAHLLFLVNYHPLNTWYTNIILLLYTKYVQHLCTTHVDNNLCNRNILLKSQVDDDKHSRDQGCQMISIFFHDFHKYYLTLARLTHKYNMHVKKMI